MSVKDELIFDFSINMPRILVSGDIAVIDHVKRIVTYSQERIILHSGKKYTWVQGRDLVLKEIRNERVLIKGELEEFRLIESLYTDGNRG